MRKYIWVLIVILVAIALLGWRPAPESEILWLDDFEAAADRAEREEKPLLLVFTADWCTYCRKLDRNVWPADRVETLVNERFVPVKIDVESEAGGSLAERYYVNGIPLMVVADGDGAMRSRLSGYHGEDDVLTWLGTFARPEG